MTATRPRVETWCRPEWGERHCPVKHCRAGWLLLWCRAMECSTFAGVLLCSTVSIFAADSIWEEGIGDGFKCGTRSVGASAGGGFGMRAWGSEQRHDFVLGNVGLGWIVTDVKGRDAWWRGNLELRGEVFGGEQLEPSRYVVGLTPELRYHFATGTRFVPFVQGGAGVSATDIKRPDLSTTFQFNLNAAAGVNVFVTDHVALNLEYRLFHLSNAGIKEPNGGVNSHLFMAGASWWF